MTENVPEKEYQVIVRTFLKQMRTNTSGWNNSHNLLFEFDWQQHVPAQALQNNWKNTSTSNQSQRKQFSFNLK